MCGIAGSVRQRGGVGLARTMIDRIAHRGPDAGGLIELAGSTVVLAHRRLSIIDPVDASDQPFVKCGLALTFNGEIYNYREIRDELASSGVRFTTGSDTEVLLEAWRRWGAEALCRLRGMFAFAIHDESTGSVTLARDPLGIKPLYVMPRGDGFLFASELKSIVAAVGPELTVDPAAMTASMLYYWLPEDYSPICGVRKLLAGSWAEYRPDGSFDSGEYWNPSSVAARAQRNLDVDIGEAVESSVEAHLVADVRVGAFLSGGLDSSLVTAIAARRNPGIETYTIAFRAQDQRMEAMPDDAHFARKVSRSLGVPLHEIEIEPEVADLLPRMVDVLDEPIGDPAAINTLLMSEAARAAGIKVMLSGMGADELFGGYRKHLACSIAHDYQRLPGMLRTRMIRPAVERLPVAMFGRGIRLTRWGQRFVSFADLREEEAFRRSYTLYGRDDLKALLTPALAGHVDAVLKHHRAVYEDNELIDHVNRMCLADTRLFMSGLNLTYTDRASMAASTEVRVPFVDPSVFEAAFSLRGSDKIRGRTQKAALKDAARRWLPDEVVDRPKASFGAPLRAWIGDDLRELVDDALVAGELVAGGYLEREPLVAMIRDQRNGRRDQAKQIWQLLTLELWYRNMRSAGVRAA